MDSFCFGFHVQKIFVSLFLKYFIFSNIKILLFSTAYNAFDLRDHFQQMKFHYVPYDYSNGIVYDQDKVMKIRLDHRAKKVRVMTEPFEIPREPDFPFKFVIHTVEILKVRDFS